MNDYISREAVVRYLKGFSEKELNSRGNFGMITSSVLDKAERAISEMPSADVQPVKHARWVEKEAYEEDRQMGFNFQIVCSNCDEQNSVLYSFDENSEPTEKYFMRTPWCPWCGAKMDLKDGDE